MTIKLNLDQWADGKSPDARVTSGAQKDLWQNGNLGGSQAHYSEGEFVPYRMVLSGLIEGHSYTVTISWDTTQQGMHALDYIGSYDYSFVGRTGETTPLATDGVTGLLTNSSTSYAIPLDPRVTAGPDGQSSTGDDVTQIAGQFSFFGGATITSVSPYTVSGSYGGNSTTSMQVTFTYNGDGDLTLGETGTAVLAWGGHIATRTDWGEGNSAVAISGSPFHMRLEAFTSITNPAEAKNVGQQDRSLSSDAVTFPASIVVHKETTPDGSAQTFDFVLERTNSVDVMSGKLDLNGDRSITTTDDGTFRDGAGEVFDIVDGVIVDRSGDGGDGKINGLTISSTSNILDLQGLGSIAFTLSDGGTKTFGGITDFGSFAVREVLPTNWQLNSIAATENDPVNAGDFNGTMTNGQAFSLTEGDTWSLTFNNGFQSQPALTITKSANVSSVSAVGDQVTYTYTITNTGNVALTNISLIDDNYTPGNTSDDVVLTSFLTGLSNQDGDGIADDLAAGASATATYTVTITQAQLDAGGSLINVGTADSSETLPTTDDATVTIAQRAALAIDKTFVSVTGGNGNTVADAAGDVLNYTVRVSNTGNVTLTGVSVNDPLTGQTISGVTLAPGTYQDYSTHYTLTQADLDGNGGGDGDIDNTATADSDQTGSISDSAAVPLVLHPDLTITKSANVSSVSAVGDQVTYTYTITNTGNVALTNISLIDDNYTPGNTSDDVVLTSFLTGLSNQDGDGIADDLAAGASATATYTVTITQAQLDAGGSLINVGTADSSETLPTTDDATVTIAQRAALAIDKTFVNVTGGNGNTVADAAGDVLNYTVRVSNTGNVTLTGVSVNDPLTGQTISGVTLAPGTYQDYSSHYTLTQADLDGNGGGDGDIDNTATADSDQTGSISDSAAVPLSLTPTLAIDKTFVSVTGGNGNTVADAAGDVLNYTVRVSNTGNVTLTGVSVNDPLTGQTISGVTLAPGTYQDYSSHYTLTQADLDGNGGGDGDIDNTATADSDQTGSISDSAAVPLSLTPTLAIDKTFVSVTGGNGNTVADAAGDVLNYTVRVSNTGNVTLTGVSVNDPLTGQTISGVTLAPGTYQDYSTHYTLTQADLDGNGGGDGDIDNTATADSDQTGSISDSAAVPLVLHPDLTITKSVLNVSGDSVNKVVDAAGDVINYRISVANSGNMALTGLVVTDTLDATVTAVDANNDGKNDGDSNGDGKLDVNETWLFDASYTATANDLSTNGGGDGDIDNIATAYSDQTVPESASAAVAVFNPVTITGNPQFNFPNDVDKIQPKLQGGSFSLNNGGYIYWDLFTSNKALAQIDTNSATVHSDYAFDVSVSEIWTDGTSAIYRVFVANNSGANISLANNTNIVDYDVIQANGAPVLSTNKGLIDLVNADPIIGNFNNFNNIENALVKDSTNHFATAPVTGTPGVDKAWLSSDESGTATNDGVKTFDAAAGHDAVYGGSNNDVMSGGAGNDIVDGRAGNDTLNGGDGNDYLYGGLGADTLVGGNGADTLFGSYGVDFLYGDSIGNETDTGGDIFILRPGDLDHLPDYDPNEDHIYIWVDTLDTTAASTPAAVTYDPATGELSYSGSLIAFLDAGLTIDTTNVGVSGGDIFVT